MDGQTDGWMFEFCFSVSHSFPSPQQPFAIDLSSPLSISVYSLLSG